MIYFFWVVCNLYGCVDCYNNIEYFLENSILNCKGEIVLNLELLIFV